MNGKNHERLNFLLLLPATFFLGWQHLDIIQSSVFITLWIIGTLFITCDLDTNSRSRKRLSTLGWIIDKVFKHRGALHNPLLWVAIGVLLYYTVGWYSLGIIIPQFVHIITDKVI
jgi:uncharacterized metal-binding protein